MDQMVDSSTQLTPTVNVRCLIIAKYVMKRTCNLEIGVTCSDMIPVFCYLANYLTLLLVYDLYHDKRHGTSVLCSISTIEGPKPIPEPI